MKRCSYLLMMAIAAASGAAHAGTPAGSNAKQLAAAKQEGFGVVREVDAAEGKVRIEHQPIPALNWPSMTMWFRLSGTLAPAIQAGDRVRFELQQDRNRAWVITRIERKQ